MTSRTWTTLQGGYEAPGTEMPGPVLQQGPPGAQGTSRKEAAARGGPKAGGHPRATEAMPNAPQTRRVC